MVPSAAAEIRYDAPVTPHQELITRIRAFAAVQTPALAGGSAVLAVSGGADSIATAALLCEASIVQPGASVVAHFDHRLRDPAAAARDRDAVEALGAGYGLALELGAWAEARAGEAAARDARYDFLTGVARRNGICAIVTGHTSDDQVETVLMQTIRGTGLHGLRGMAAQRVIDGALTLVRPLLCVSREETRTFCAELGLAYHDDATNADRAYLRNRVRLDVLPQIDAAAPGAREAILRLAADARAGVAALEAIAREALDSARVRIDDGEFVLSRGVLGVVPSAVAPYVWRLALERLCGDAHDFERKHYDIMCAATDAATGSVFELPRGLRLTVDAREVVLSRGAIIAEAIAVGEERVLPFAGVLGGWRLTIESAPAVATLAACVALPEGAVVRGRRPGDRIQPRGMRGHKKLQDYYVDRKIARRERDAAPVIACGGDVLWTPFGRAEDARSGGRAFRIEAERVGRGPAA